MKAVSLLFLVFFIHSGLAFGDSCANRDRELYNYPVVRPVPETFHGIDVNQFRAFGFKDGKWHPIAIQVDERNSRDEYVLEHGLPFTKGTDDGWADANDEIVLRGQDLGDDFSDTEIPRSLLKRGRQYAKLSLCGSNHFFGAALIIGYANADRDTFESLVKFDSSKGTIDSNLYRYRFDQQNPALLGEVALRKDNSLMPIISSSRFVMPLEMPWYLPDIVFRGEDFSSEIECWRIGPIRTIVAVGVKYTSFLNLFKLHLFSELIFYENRFQVPTVIEFIFDPSEYLNPGSGLAYSLKFPEGKTWELETNLPSLQAVAPEKSVEVTASDVETFTVRGWRPEGSFLVEVVVDPAARAMVPPPALMAQKTFADSAYLGHFPWLGEIAGDLGIFLDFSRVKKGVYDFGLDLVLSSKAKETFTDFGYVDALWHPLSVPVSRD